MKDKETPVLAKVLAGITVAYARSPIDLECEMRENYDIKVEGGAYGLKITKQGLFKDNLGKVCVAICPECGYLEF